VTAPIIGARSLEQLQQNLGALDVPLTAAQRQRLDDVSKIVPGHPYAFFGDASRQMMYGGAAVTRWRPA